MVVVINFPDVGVNLQMQSNAAKHLACQLAGRDSRLKDMSSFLATQTHVCKHADHLLAASPSLECCLPVMPCICLPLGLTPTVHPSASHLDYVSSCKGCLRRRAEKVHSGDTHIHGVRPMSHGYVQRVPSIKVINPFTVSNS